MCYEVLTDKEISLIVVGVLSILYLLVAAYVLVAAFMIFKDEWTRHDYTAPKEEDEHDARSNDGRYLWRADPEHENVPDQSTEQKKMLR